MGVRANTGRLVLAGLAVAASLTVAPATAQATAPALDGYVMEVISTDGRQATVRFSNKATNRCLTAEWDDHIHAVACDGRWSQDWSWTGDPAGWASVKNAQTGRCLDGTRTTGRIYAGGCNGGSYQLWRHHDGGRMTQQQSGHRLDGNNEGSVYLSPPNDGPHQVWFS